MTHTQDELIAICGKMTAVSNMFYANAIQCDCHAFVEFTGLMNEFIKICKHAAHQGIDFTEASGHCGGVLPILDFQANYLAEKLACILGPTLGAMPKKARDQFCKRLLGN